jgi:formylglycine-generating enzyme required for sulfatase activity
VGEWITACTGGERRYPYGDFFDANACNTEAPAEQWSYVEDVGKRLTCEGGFEGIFDLAGNVEEWIDACEGNAGAEDSCEMYGGHAWRGRLKPDDVSCRESNYPVKRRAQYQLRGFRCCADPVP